MADAVSDDALDVALKRLRAAAGLTQEELADRAGISARTVSDVERGLRTAIHGDTARRLASALGLRDEDRARFDTVARGPVQVGGPAGRPGALPVPPTRLLGRSGELASITARLQSPDVRLLTLTGPGGIGKTRLALEGAVQVQALFAGGVFFVSLGELKDASRRARVGQGDRRRRDGIGTGGAADRAAGGEADVACPRHVRAPHSGGAADLLPAAEMPADHLSDHQPQWAAAAWGIRVSGAATGAALSDSRRAGRRHPTLPGHSAVLGACTSGAAGPGPRARDRLAYR